MKKQLLLFLFAISFLNINAQEVEATTSAGTKIMINLNNYTWRYANTTDAQKPCYTNHRGSIHFYNQSTQVVYVYYGKANWDGIDYVKINSGDSAQVNDLHTGIGSSSGKAIDYKWTVSYEFYKNINKYKGYSNGLNNVSDIKGFNTGRITLDDCEIEKIYIKD